MKIEATFSPSLKNCPSGSGHRLRGELDEATGILWVACTPNVYAPQGRFGVQLAGRVIVAPLEAAGRPPQITTPVAQAMAAENAENTKRGPGRPPKATVAA